MTLWLKTKDGSIIDVDDEYMRNSSKQNLFYFLKRETGKPDSYWRSHKKELMKLVKENEVIRHYWNVMVKYNVHVCSGDCEECSWGILRVDKFNIEYWGCTLKDKGIRVITEVEEEFEEAEDDDEW